MRKQTGPPCCSDVLLYAQVLGQRALEHSAARPCGTRGCRSSPKIYGPHWPWDPSAQQVLSLSKPRTRAYQDELCARQVQRTDDTEQDATSDLQGSEPGPGDERDPWNTHLGKDGGHRRGRGGPQMLCEGDEQVCTEWCLSISGHKVQIRAPSPTGCVTSGRRLNLPSLSFPIAE